MISNHCNECALRNILDQITGYWIVSKSNRSCQKPIKPETCPQKRIYKTNNIDIHDCGSISFNLNETPFANRSIVSIEHLFIYALRTLFHYVIMTKKNPNQIKLERMNYRNK